MAQREDAGIGVDDSSNLREDFGELRSIGGLVILSTTQVVGAAGVSRTAGIRSALALSRIAALRRHLVQRRVGGARSGLRPEADHDRLHRGSPGGEAFDLRGGGLVVQ